MDAHTDVDAALRARHGRWAGFFITAALLVLALSASALGDGRILVGVVVTLLSVGLVYLSAELRRPSSQSGIGRRLRPPSQLLGLETE